MIRAAVIGVGPHGRRIIDAITQSPKLRLDAIVDHSAAALERAGVGREVKKFESSDRLFDSGGADLICVATNGPSHVALTVQAIEAGAQFVMVEKPMACSIDECSRMLAAAESHGARIAVDHPRRLHPAYRWMRSRIASGQWGELREIKVQLPGIGLGCKGTHSFDLVRFLSDRAIKRVTGWVDGPIGPNPRGDEFVDPGGLAVLELDGGARGIVSQLEDGSGPMTLEVSLTRGRVRYDEKRGTLEVVTRDLRVVPKPDKPASYETVPPPPDLSLTRNLRSEIQRLLEGFTEPDEHEDDGATWANGRDGAASIEVLIGTYVSSQRGNVPVLLPLEDAKDRSFWIPVT